MEMDGRGRPDGAADAERGEWRADEIVCSLDWPRGKAKGTTVNPSVPSDGFDCAFDLLDLSASVLPGKAAHGPVADEPSTSDLGSDEENL
jgi:hypothetical protein